MAIIDRIKSFLRPLPGQTVMERGDEDRDPRLKPDNALHDPGETRPNRSLEEEMEDDVR